VGGFLADYFSNRSFVWNIQWEGPHGIRILTLLQLHSLGFLFIIGGVLAFIALKTLSLINEKGEVPKELAISEVRSGFRNEFKNKLTREALLSLLYSPLHFQNLLQKKIKNTIENKLVNMRKWRSTLAEKRTA